MGGLINYIVANARNAQQVRFAQAANNRSRTMQKAPNIKAQASKSGGSMTVNDSCPCCSDGMFRKGNIGRDCFRCDGKGYIVQSDIDNYQGWLAIRSSPDRRTYRDYDNAYKVFH